MIGGGDAAAAAIALVVGAIDSVAVAGIAAGIAAVVATSG